MTDAETVSPRFLEATGYFNFEHESVAAFTAAHTRAEASPRENAISLYLAVRDGIRYNPYTFLEGPRSLKASFCFENLEAYCIPKAVLLGAVARRAGIPSRLGLADVRNHMASPKLLELLRTDVFAMHGYVELHLEGRWVKATPAFNRDLCEKFGTEPLEFDGLHDSLLQPLDRSGRRYMEYLRDHGVFADVPFQLILDTLFSTYPHLAAARGGAAGSSLEKDLG